MPAFVERHRRDVAGGAEIGLIGKLAMPDPRPSTCSSAT
jgi:hypothetical protein